MTVCVVNRLFLGGIRSHVGVYKLLLFTTFVRYCLFVYRHSLPKVKLMVCRRANKTVTLVDNLELYGIPAGDVAHRIQRMAACHSAGMYLFCRLCVCVCVCVYIYEGIHCYTCTVQATPGGSQVLIQGNQVKSTVKILEGVFIHAYSDYAYNVVLILLL